jgi:Mrp family chromosome partitioning ATPase
MTKQVPPSLLERAAELYDFGAPLRTPASAPVPAAAPAFEPEVPVARRPAPIAPEPAPIAFDPIPVAPADPVEPFVPEPRPFALRADGAAPIDRDALALAGFVVPGGEVTGIAEEFRLIKRQLLAGIERRVSLADEKRRAVLITSAQPGDGKSFSAINLALSLSGEHGIEVLLIDGDFSKPDLLQTLGIPTGPGMVEALTDPSSNPNDFVIRTDVPGLSVLPAGRKSNNVPELLASDRTREVLAKLIAGDRRRIILFDSPPALMASPATVLAGHVGQVLVVVRADRTTEADLRETIGLLSGCDHVGLILNGAGIAVNGRKFGGYDGYGHDQ